MSQRGARGASTFSPTSVDGEVTAKVVVLGEAFVGKSSLATRFARDEFSSTQEPTIGAAFVSHRATVPQGTVKFEIWDTAGQERYRSLTPMYYRGAVAALVVYDVTMPDSLRRARTWIQELRGKAREGLVLALVGNKCDLDDKRQISEDQGAALAEEETLNGGGDAPPIFFAETSAKTGKNVQAVFDAMATRILEAGVGASAARGTGGPAGAAGNARNLRDTRAQKKDEEPSKCAC